jgi:hypothetical protein
MLFIPMEDPSAARGRFLYLMFMFLLFMMLSPNPPNPYRLLALEALASREKHSLEALTNATFEAPFYVPPSLNVTGVRPPSRHNRRLTAAGKFGGSCAYTDTD